jgi:hypothetical protein
MIDTVTKIYDFNNNFCSYDVTYTGTNVTKSVPLDEANTDYQAIQQWIADGGTVIDNGGGE